MLTRVKRWGSALRARLTWREDVRAGAMRAFEFGVWALLGLVPLVVFFTAMSFYNALALVLVLCMGLLLAGLVWLGVRVIGRFTPRLQWTVLLLGLVMLPFVWMGAAFYALMMLYVGAVLAVGGGLALLRRGTAGWRGPIALAGGCVVLLGLIAGFGVAGWGVEEEIRWEPMQDAPLALADPGLPGPHAVETFTYGPGKDPHREVFGEAVRYVTEPVDGSKLLDGWEGISGWARTAYWNADAENLPVRGRVWIPAPSMAASGPLPLVLIVHGNHAMEDFSDDGYAYLGELFASRGSIAVSVDENFLNSSLSSLLGLFEGGLEEENDARGWMLLEHVRQFRDWNEDTTHPLHGRVDIDRVVLIGHSRGGEAVSEAALFNQLAHYPDDATLSFDYRFGIRGVIAIAPVDHQYHPRDIDTVMRDVSYLVIHGSHDSDVNSYAGYAAYSRLWFDDCMDCFKAGLYLIGANHGQFNTGWGAYDAPAPFSSFLNAGTLMDGDAQRRVAAVLFSAFLEATVHENGQYRELLAAPHRQAELFGETARFLSHYRGADDIVIADFEEDADPATAGFAQARITSADLTLWREADLGLKWRSADNAMVLLGWQAAGARYDVANLTLPADATTLSFSLGMSEAAPGDLEDYVAPDSIDFLVELEDAGGGVAALPISARRALLPQVKAVMYKLPGLDSDPPSEVVMQRYRFDLAEFAAMNPQLDLTRLKRVGLHFNLTEAGSLWFDDLTVSRRAD